MPHRKIEDIIIKYFSKTASIDEMIELAEWMDEQSNDLIFMDFVRTNYLVDANVLDFNTAREKEKILQKIKKEEKSIRINRFNKSIFKYAAVFAIMLSGFGYYYMTDGFYFYKKQKNTTDINIHPGTHKAILTLGNGKLITLKKGQSYQTTKAVSNGKEIVYNKATSKKIVYNTLTIPRGGQFNIVLSDGTKVWLNSDSKLRYPTNFIDGQPREVELVYGEAYFDVSHSSNLNGTLFKVHNQIQDIEVLGTEFNIRAYKDEQKLYTTLVQGKIAIENGIVGKLLNPGQQAIISIKNKDIVVTKVNVAFEISWKNGLFIFDKEPLGSMMKTLSRWYDIKVFFKNKEKQHIIFSGILDRSNNIEELLKNIARTGEAKFEINDKTLTVK